MATKYKIVKGQYQVFRGDASGSEPMEEFNEAHLSAWLQSRGFSEKQATELIRRIDIEISASIEVPDPLD